ncbi:hypothetical protein ACFFNY_14270 [Paenibacillus hodogayensis]|uniref:Uncharacterized protein n=1 Tax=Paenibacillus hodogayensis TaxID=279208 RepID=A0ABV5VWN1_9BACL
MPDKRFAYAYALVLLVLGFALIFGCGEKTKPEAPSSGKPPASQKQPSPAASL